MENKYGINLDKWKETGEVQLYSAHEFLNKEYYHIVLDSKDTWVNVGDIESAMVEFARIHIENFAKDFNLSCEYRQQLVENYIRKIIR